jgi:hypothetical protein
MNKIVVCALLLLCWAASMGQDKKKKKKEEEKPPVFNYVIDNPMDKLQAQPEAPPVYYQYFVPEFYFPKQRKDKDTTYEFTCYDMRDTLMPVVSDYDSVFFYSLYKSYVDSQHTYRDKDGKNQLLPVSYIVKRYDRVGKAKWMTIEYPGNKYGELRVIRNIIVRRDTDKVYDALGANIYNKVFNYYKLIP